MIKTKTYIGRVETERILSLSPEDFQKHNFPFQRHFDSDEERKDCYVLHHASGVTSLFYYDVLGKISNFNAKLTGKKPAIDSAKKDLSSLLGTELKEKQ